MLQPRHRSMQRSMCGHKKELIISKTSAKSPAPRQGLACGWTPRKTQPKTQRKEEKPLLSRGIGIPRGLLTCEAAGQDQPQLTDGETEALGCAQSHTTSLWLSWD